MLDNRKGQSMAEYALAVVIIIAAVAGMQTYYKRGLQAKIKHVMDTVNIDTATTGTPAPITQYEPYYGASTFSTTQSSTEDETYQVGGQVDRDTKRFVSRTGSQTESGGVALPQDDAWNQGR